MEHVTFKGTHAFPNHARRVRGDRGLRRLVSNAATDRESTVYWARVPMREAERAFERAGRADRPAAAASTRHRPRARHHRRGDPLVPGRSRPVRLQPFRPAFFGDTPLGWEIAGDEDSVRGLTDDDIKTFWIATYKPSNMVVAAAGDMEHAELVDRVRELSAPATADVPPYVAAPNTAV